MLLLEFEVLGIDEWKCLTLALANEIVTLAPCWIHFAKLAFMFLYFPLLTNKVEKKGG